MHKMAFNYGIDKKLQECDINTKIEQNPEPEAFFGIAVAITDM